MSTNIDELSKDESALIAFKAKKFAMWLFIIASFMIFAALSSGYIVYTAAGVDRGIKILLPQAFITSTILFVLSSLTVHIAFKATQSREYTKRRVALLVSILLGAGFFFSQYYAWQALIDQGAYFINNNASQSFIYVFTGFHMAHILGGLIVLIVSLFRNLNKFSHIQNINSMELTVMFWHFLDILWIYIYVFLLLNQ